MENQPVRIAQVLGYMNNGGIEAVVMNYYRAVDRSRVQFDFFFDQNSSLPMAAEMERLGAGIYPLPPYSRLPAYVKLLERYFREKQYPVVHAQLNTMSVFPLYAAERAGVPVRIVHNHSAAAPGEGLRSSMKYLLRPFAATFATDRFACGEKAGRWMFGSRAFDAGKVRVFPNAIDPDKYAFDPLARRAIRDQLGIADGVPVVGHVGRFVYPKNHMFLLDVFAAVKRRRPDAVLLLTGEGELEASVRARVAALGLTDSVRFLGVYRGVEKLYSAMDALCLPSFYEGLPVVGIEALANGLPLVLSERITREILVDGRTRVAALSDGADVWADAVTEMAQNRPETGALPEQFNIHRQAALLTEFYLSACRRGRSGQS